MKTLFSTHYRVQRWLLQLCLLGCCAALMPAMLCAMQQPSKGKTRGDRTSPAATTQKPKATSSSIQRIGRTQRSTADSSDNPRSAHLQAMAKGSRDSVILRWAPDKAGAWMLYSSIGYIVERHDLADSASQRQVAFTRLTLQPLKAWTLKEWESNGAGKKEGTFLAIAAQCLHGKASTSLPPSSEVERMRYAGSELSNRHGFALFAADNDARAAEGLALRFVDRKVSAGHIYIYRIYPAYSDSSYALDTAVVSVKAESESPLPAPMALSAEEGEAKITLRWKEQAMYAYSGYQVWRRNADGKEERLSQMPVVAMTPAGAFRAMQPFFVDSTCGYYTPRSYIVRGITPFADFGEAATIVAQGRDRTPPPMPVLKKPLIFGSKTVRIEWEMKKSIEDIEGFVVMKSDSPSTRFVAITPQLLSAKTFAYLDTNASEFMPYYTVVAVDTAGNHSDWLATYCDIHDTLPPATPTGLTGSIDTNGVVTLRWRLNSEADMLGYRVLWANQADHEFTQRTNYVWQDTVFRDTVSIKTLTPYIFYQVVAVDTRYFHSQPTALLALRRPDVVPPQMPVFTTVTVDEGSISLQWARSQSADVKEHILYKRVQGSEWKEYVHLDQRTELFRDTSVSKKIVYEYQLVAVDSSGLRSQVSATVQGRPYDTGRRPAVSDVQVHYDSTTKKMSLQWSYTPAVKEKYWFVILRAFEDFPLRDYQAAEATERSFRDKDLVGRGRYRYAVRVVTATGESPLSQIQEVIVR